MSWCNEASYWIWQAFHLEHGPLGILCNDDDTIMNKHNTRAFHAAHSTYIHQSVAQCRLD